MKERLWLRRRLPGRTITNRRKSLMSKSPESARRILFIDDDADTCELMHIVLEPSGHEVMTAETIADALSLAEAERFDLYIIDGWLPDGSGIELCRRLRALCPTSPILFYSGVAQESEIRRAERAGADGYL